MFETLKEMDSAGVDVRLWCFRCARGERMDSNIWMVFEDRGWPTDLPSAGSRFRCRKCKKKDQILLVPATRPPQPPITWARLVEQYFHSQRALSKKRRNR